MNYKHIKQNGKCQARAKVAVRDRDEQNEFSRRPAPM